MCTPSRRERRFEEMRIVTPKMSVSPRRERHFFKMCTPSKRERRFDPLKAGKQLMRFLRFCSKMNVSRRRNERLEKRNSENRKCQKTHEKSTCHVGDDQTRLKMRTTKRHEHVKCPKRNRRFPFSPRVRMAIFRMTSEGLEAK
jgi:hypothetical protein